MIATAIYTPTPVLMPHTLTDLHDSLTSVDTSARVYHESLV